MSRRSERKQRKQNRKPRIFSTGVIWVSLFLALFVSLGVTFLLLYVTPQDVANQASIFAKTILDLAKQLATGEITLAEYKTQMATLAQEMNSFYNLANANPLTQVAQYVSWAFTGLFGLWDLILISRNFSKKRDYEDSQNQTPSNNQYYQEPQYQQGYNQQPQYQQPYNGQPPYNGQQ